MVLWTLNENLLTSKCLQHRKVSQVIKLSKAENILSPSPIIRNVRTASELKCSTESCVQEGIKNGIKRPLVGKNLELFSKMIDDYTK